MTDKVKSALRELLKTLLSAAVAFITALLATSCGTTRAVITNRADNTQTEVKITTNNPTTVNVSPETTLELVKQR